MNLFEELCISSVYNREEGFEDYRYTVSMVAELLGFDVFRNPESPGLTQEQYEEHLRTHHPVFICLLGAKESRTVERELQIALEECLPIYIFVQSNYYKEISDTEKQRLKSLAYDRQCYEYTNCKDLYALTYRRLVKYIAEKEIRRPLLQKGVQLAYETNTKLMETSKRQIVIYHNTSLLLLGPRRQCLYEIEFYRTLTEWLSQNKNNNIQFLHVFNWEETLREKREHSDQYAMDVAKENIMTLYRDYQGINNGNSGLNIRFSDYTNSVPYVITDMNLVFILPIERERFSLEIPSHVMKLSDISVIIDEITRNTEIVDEEKLLEFYS